MANKSNRTRLDYNLILRVEDESWESLDSMSFRNLVVFSCIHLGNVAGWVLGSEGLGCLGVFWSKFLAVSAVKEGLVKI